jgi:hypothetical protein
MNFREFLSAQDASGSISPHLALISASRQDRPHRLNHARYRELEADIHRVSGWQYVPVDGMAVESNEKTGTKLPVKEKSFLVMAGATTTRSFLEYLVHWLNKYEQEYALVRFSNEDTAWKLLPSGNRFVYGSWDKLVKPNLPQ